MNDDASRNGAPSPESIQRAWHDASDGWGSSCPSLDGLRSVLSRLEDAGTLPSSTNEEENDDATCFGRFQVEHELGKGGSGWVFLATDRTLNRRVALKIPRLRYAGSETLRRAWLNEAEAAARLDHPHIVPVYEAGEIDSLVYIASAYCPGPTLAEWLRGEGGTVRPERAARIIAQLADGVAHAHQRGILHRDIKPSNVLCQQQERSDSQETDFVARLTDFGLARSLTQEVVDGQQSDPVGTPRYMAPEQVEGNEREIGVATDIHALGAVLYELLTGEPPFADADVQETLRRIQHEEVSPARLVARRVPPDLRAICLKCLARMPADRYTSAAELRDDLQRFLQDRPVRVRPLGPLATMGRWCRRRPALVASLALAALLSVSGAGGVWWYAQQAERLAEKARHHELVAQEQAADARRHFDDAQRALLDLGWVAQESTVWIDRPDNFRSAVRGQLNLRYQQLIESAIQSSDPTLRAAALSVEGAQASQAGEGDRSDELFRASLALWRDAIRRHPDNPLYRRSMALALFSYGQHLQRADRDAESEATLAEGFEVFSEVAGREASIPMFREEYATLLFELGCNYKRAGQRERAARMFEQSLAQWGALVEQEPRNPNYRMRKGQSGRLLAESLGVRRHAERIRELLLSSQADLEAAAADEPHRVDRRVQLAEAHRALGKFLREGARREAQAHYDRAADILRPLVEEGPADGILSALLAETLAELAERNRETGQFNESLALSEEAIALWSRLDEQGPLTPRVLSSLAIACVEYAELALQRRQIDNATRGYEQAHDLYTRLHQEHSRLTQRGCISWSACYVFRGDRLLASDPLQAAEHYRGGLELVDRALAKLPHDVPLQQRRQEILNRLSRAEANDKPALDAVADDVTRSH